jgi:hypothetical protein
MRMLAAVSLLPVLVAAQAPTPLAVGETFTIASQVLGERRTINVYAPPGHPLHDGPPLPLVVMPDGGLAEDFLHVAGLVQVGAGNGTMRPVLLVGIENTARRRDLTGPTTVARDSAIAPVVGGSAAFRRFIREELLPAIAARYRVTNQRTIIGESLAGLFVLETMLAEPTLFDTWIAIDPSLWWNDGTLLRTAPSMLRTTGAAREMVVLAHSDQAEIAAASIELAAVLRGARHVTSLLLPFPRETHATIYHPAALAAFRLVLAPLP